ncbi:MAG: glycoside hydrolase family 25 protein [Clostridium sp.]|nr:glycoside hydrolase family 25 protein [Acetatifactor muris]MCM1528050.1 glycoside hydrolase family 25 protein [Bacteroides sp.]MCM1564212.1 glycoside hydrolase family 25 protein [Clostridium sp.]
MRLPDEFEENRNALTPAVLSAIVAVALFVGAILVIVLVMNNQNNNRHSMAESGTKEPEIEQSQGMLYPDTDDLLSGRTLSPDDLDFWDKYPETTSESGTAPESASKETTAVPENDPATDGKHTMVVNRDGKEEWVLISPYLPKHEYDFTKLVCQSDLMKYYEEGRQVSYVGVDISKYQDYVDFVKVRKAGVNFVMIRVGARGYGSGQLVMDEYFTDNIKRATDAGLQVGVYFSSQAVTTDEALEEAQLVTDALAEYRISYPVAFDMGFVDNDTARIESLSKSEKTEIAKTFLDAVGAAGYMPMIYGDKEWLIKEIDMSKLTAYDVWLSQIKDVPDYPYRFTMWQYTKSASVDGIAGYANLNVSFIDYSEK